MRLRAEKPKVTDQEEGALEQSVRGLLRNAPEVPPPPEAYWHNFLIRTNQRIDDATSGKAISLSWAARVAIPGVVAILSFLIGLRYFAPDRPPVPASLTEATSALSVRAVDSLIVHSLATADTATGNAMGGSVLLVSHEQAAEYLCATEGTPALLSDLSDAEIREVLLTLGAGLN